MEVKSLQLWQILAKALIDPWKFHIQTQWLLVMEVLGLCTKPNYVIQEKWLLLKKSFKIKDLK